MTQLGKPQIPAGDSFRLIFDVVGGDKLPLSVANCSISWKMAVTEYDLVVVAKEVGTGIWVDSLLPSRFYVQLDPEDTAALPPMDYYHQAKVIFTDTTVVTVLQAHLTILKVLA